MNSASKALTARERRRNPATVEHLPTLRVCGQPVRRLSAGSAPPRLRARRARCPNLHRPPHVMAASPNREDTRNTYE
jgi:hypothetical protein